MKRLYLVRHAKADSGTYGLDDFDRPLNKRGKKDAPRMGKHLKRVWQVAPDRVLCSTAKRARSTAKRLRKALDISKKQIAWHERIYSGHKDDVLKDSANRQSPSSGHGHWTQPGYDLLGQSTHRVFN